MHDPTADRRRLHGLLAAGLIDSSGLAFGWTVFTLAVTARHGVGAVAVYQAAMLAGVALSAPFTRWVTARVDARTLLRALAVGEGACRASVLLLLLAAAPAAVLAITVVVMNVLAWTGYAAMRAEVAAVEPGSVALTRYALCIAGAEALAAAAAALVIQPSHRGPVLAVIPVYCLALVPQWWAGGAARVVRRPPPRAVGALPPRREWRMEVAQPHLDIATPNITLVRPRRGRPALPAGVGAWAGGGIVMVGASGPALLASALAFERYGREGVAVSALALTMGSLIGPSLSARIERAATKVELLRRPSVLWPLLGALMVGGWAAADVSLAGLVLAQTLTGMGQTTLEGVMDDHCVRRGATATATNSLSGASASRAIGGAVAVAVLPTLLRHVPLVLVAELAAWGLLAAAGTTVIVQGRRVPIPSGDGPADDLVATSPAGRQGRPSVTT